jgi:outer membrane immunogenic protein
LGLERLGAPEARYGCFPCADISESLGGFTVKKSVLLATLSQLPFIATGSAADLPRKAPPMVAPAYSWTGCYAGAHVGYGWGRSDVTESNWSIGPGGSANLTSTLESDGAIYGGQLGCNFQLESGAFGGRWVAGIQGDFAGTSIRGDVGDPLNGHIDNVGTLGMKTKWLASITGRLGVTGWNNRALFYAKGGVAWVKNEWDLSASGYCAFYDFLGGCGPSKLNDSRAGWTAGGGVEWIIVPSSPKWTAFVEYNYYRFHGNGPPRLVGVEFTDPRNAITPGNRSIQTVKLGVNYKLFGP